MLSRMIWMEHKDSRSGTLVTLEKQFRSRSLITLIALVGFLHIFYFRGIIHSMIVAGFIAKRCINIAAQLLSFRLFRAHFEFGSVMEVLLKRKNCTVSLIRKD